MNNNNFLNNDNNSLNNDEEKKNFDKLSPKKKQDIQKLFIFLIIFGLIIGGMVSVVLIKAMNQFGLTDKTPQFERINK